MSPSYSTGISFRFDQPGQKHLLATSGVGSDQNVLARTDLIVHSQVDNEIDIMVRTFDQFGARPWFQSILERHHDDPAYKERLDLVLCQHLTSPVDPVRETAFNLLVQMHERTLRKAATRFLKRDEHAIDDVIQEATRCARRSLRLFEPGRRFGPWIHSTLLNVCRDAKRRIPLTPGNVDREASHHDEAIASIDARDALDRLLRDVNRSDVEILTLRHGHDMSYIDIARTLNIQPDRPDQTRVSTVRRQVERLERNLRAAHGFRGDTSDTGGIA